MDLLCLGSVIWCLITGDLKYALVIASTAGFTIAGMVIFRKHVELVNPFKRR
jgi:hypothetical protein